MLPIYACMPPFIEKLSNHQDVKVADVEPQQQLLNVLYEWFHNAHHVYQLHCSGGEVGAGLVGQCLWELGERDSGTCLCIVPLSRTSDMSGAG